jgi:lipoprotein
VQEAVVENARKNVSWQGTYQGILPCSACEGVATMIVLNPNMTYTTRTRMLGIDDKDRTGEGRFEWLPDNSHIAIDSEGQRKVFRVHSDHLEMRMPNGDAIPTANPEAFQLMKTE